MSLLDKLKKPLRNLTLVGSIGLASLGFNLGDNLSYAQAVQENSKQERTLPEINHYNYHSLESLLNQESYFKHAKKYIDDSLDRDYIFLSDINNAGYQELILKFREDTEANFSGAVKHRILVLSKDNSNVLRPALHFIDIDERKVKVSLELQDLDNDNTYELVVKKCCGGNRGSGSLYIFKAEGNNYHRIDGDEKNGIQYIGSDGIEIKDIDDDGIKEVISDRQARKPDGASIKRYWGVVSELKDGIYQDSTLRELEDDTFTTSADPNPYNIPEPKVKLDYDKFSKPSQDIPRTQQIIESVPYTQDYSNQVYGYEEKPVRLRLILEEVLEKSSDTSNNRIRDAEVHVKIKPYGSNLGQKDNYYRPNWQGVVDVYEDFLAPINQDAEVLIEVQAPPYELFKERFDLSRLDTFRNNERYGNLTVIKGINDDPSYCDTAANLNSCYKDDVVLMLKLEHKNDRKRR